MIGLDLIRRISDSVADKIGFFTSSDETKGWILSASGVSSLNAVTMGVSTMAKVATT